MNSNLKQQLKKYSALSAGLISCASANATVQPGNINHTINNFNYYIGGANVKTFGSVLYDIDVNGDGVVDFKFGDAINSGTPIPLGSSYYKGISPFIYGVNGEVVANGSATYTPSPYGWFQSSYGVTPPSMFYAEQLNIGLNINSTQNFQKYTRLVKNGSKSYPNNIFSNTLTTFRNGNWSAETQTNFLGLKFNIGANVHYGWIRITVDNLTHDLTFVDYAYEDVPNTPISTGQMFLAPPPANSALVNYSSSSLIASFQASSAEESVKEYRMFVVKEGTTFDLATAESNTNFIAITPDGSATYSHTFESTTPDSDGDIFTKSKDKSIFLDTDGMIISADQSYRVYILNVAEAPIAEINSLSTPSGIYTVVEPTVGLEEIDKQFSTSFNNNQLNITIDNTLIGAQIEVFDLLGKSHISKKLKSINSRIDFDLPNGTYIVSIRKEDYLNTNKFIISK